MEPQQFIEMIRDEIIRLCPPYHDSDTDSAGMAVLKWTRQSNAMYPRVEFISVQVQHHETRIHMNFGVVPVLTLAYDDPQFFSRIVSMVDRFRDGFTSNWRE